MTDTRPRNLNGYAPGSYMNKCCHCEEEFTGDKRAITCFRCAVAQTSDEIARLTARVAGLESALGMCSSFHDSAADYFRRIGEAAMAEKIANAAALLRMIAGKE